MSYPFSLPELDYDYDALHSMNVHQLQEIAENIDHQAVHGFTTMHKEELLHALCQALGMPAGTGAPIVALNHQHGPAQHRLLPTAADGRAPMP